MGERSATRGGGLFLRTTLEALESVSSPNVAHAIVSTALARCARTEVPEEIGPFRAFVEGPLQAEVQRQLGAASVSHVLERLGHVLWMATSDVHALSVARDWVGLTKPDAPRPAGDADESGEFAVSTVPFAPSEPHKRPTTPAPELAKTSSAPPRAGSPMPPRSPVPTASPVPPRGSPLPPRAPDVVVPRPPSSAGIAIGKLTMSKLVRASPRPLPTAVLVVSLDPMLATQTTVEIAGRCSVLRISTPSDLARAAASAGERLVVIVDTALPSIDLPTFVALAPILPAATRIVLWGADERQRARLVSMFPAASGWVASGDSTTPGELALAQL